MDLTLIDPDDPSADPFECSVRGAEKDDNSARLAYEAWIGRYSTAAFQLKSYVDPGEIADLRGYEAVIANNSGDVIAAGVLDSIANRRNKYYFQILVTPSPDPTF